MTLSSYKDNSALPPPHTKPPDLETLRRPVEHLVTDDQDGANGCKFVIVLRPSLVLVLSSHHVNIEFLSSEPFVEFFAPILHQRA